MHFLLLCPAISCPAILRVRHFQSILYSSRVPELDLQGVTIKMVPLQCFIIIFITSGILRQKFCTVLEAYQKLDEKPPAIAELRTTLQKI